MMYSIRPAAAAENATESGPWNERYPSLNDAAEALRTAMGWREVLLAPGFSAHGGQEWRAYSSQTACNAGEPNAPFVRRDGVNAPVLEP